MFQLTPDEKAEVVANCDHLALLKFSPSLPYAFTEHGAVMAASVLKSKRAIEVSVFVVRAFVRMSQALATLPLSGLAPVPLNRRVGPGFWPGFSPGIWTGICPGILPGFSSGSSPGF